MGELVRHSEWSTKLNEATEKRLDRNVARWRRDSVPNAASFWWIVLLWYLCSTIMVPVVAGPARLLMYLGWALVSLALAALGPWNRKRILLAAPELLDRLDDPSTGTQYPMVVILKRNGLLIGGDEGVIVFNDGWMVYQGFRTYFSIRARDISAWREGIGPNQSMFVHQPAVVLTLAESGEELHLPRSESTEPVRPSVRPVHRSR